MANKNTWERKIEAVSYLLQTEPKDTVDEAYQWALSKVENGFLLAHALDGVTWGTVKNHQLVQDSSSVLAKLSPSLKNRDNLLELRLFNADCEAFIWRVGAQWRCRLIDDRQDEISGDAFTECQILWGTESKKAGDFTILRSGSQGLRHAVPADYDLPSFSASNPLKERVVLQVKHYLQQRKSNGMLYSALSRLYGIDQVDFTRNNNNKEGN